MTDADQHLMTLFTAAQECGSDAERAAYLDRACGGDPAIRERLEALLRAHGGAGRFLEATPDNTPTAPPAGAAAGTVLGGRFKLLEVIGEGGMGEVWLAQQQEPVRRSVALKVIKAGMDTRSVLARFEAERQALALMDHPNIAKVYDAGVSPDGRPFIVMELVKGTPITKYCDEHQLTPKQRLELFVPVCQAVQHAHQKGVIHRDLKPSNVLVAPYDGVPVPKVIDFGVAKAAGQPLTDKTLVTGLGAVVGTPEYMSPEQAELNNQDIDTRSDVYSLGVLLYELLAGGPPFSRTDLEKASMLEMLRVIREQEPSRPSTKLGTAEGLPTLAANRGTEPAKLTRVVRGELDWIVMKALEKDRNRRYETANGLAIDVQRYLADEPVLACPPSAGYRLRKFARRNRRTLLTAAVAGTALLATAGSVGWAVRDRAARQADAERDKQARDVEADREAHLALQEAALLRDRGDWPKAQLAVQRAVWLLTAAGSDDTRERAEVMGGDLRMVERLEEIRLCVEAAVAAKLDRSARPERDVVVESYGEAFKDYGIDVSALGAPVAAAQISDSAIRKHLVAALDDWMYVTLRNVPSWAHIPAMRIPSYEHLRTVADLAAPDEWCRRVRDREVQKDRRALEELADAPDVAGRAPSGVMFLAKLLQREGATGKAAKLLYDLQHRYPDDFSVNYQMAHLLASPQTAPARLEEPIGFLRAAVALRPHFPQLHRDLGRLLEQAGRLDQAVAAYRTAFDLNPPGFYQELANALQAKEDWEGAFAVYGRVIALNPNEALPHAQLGLAYRRARRWDKAIAEYHEASRLPQGRYSNDFELTWLLATCPDVGLRDPAQAVARAWEDVQSYPRNAKFREALGVASYRAGDWAGAVAALEEAHRLYPNGGSGGEWFLAMAYWQLGERERARRWYDRALQWKAFRTAQLHLKEECERCRAEAAGLLGVKDSPFPAAEELNLERAFPAAAARLLAGDAVGYRQVCARLLEHGDRLTCANLPGRKYYLLARLCLLAPDAVADPDQPAWLAGQAIKSAPRAAWHLHTLGLAHYRGGRHDEALVQFEESRRENPEWAAHPLSGLALAMAHHRLGHADQAREWLANTVRTIDHDRLEHPQAPTALGMRAHDWTVWQLFRREAERLINGADK